MKWFRKRNRSPLSLSLSHLPPPRHMAGADPDSKWLIIAERCQRARAGANLSPSLSLYTNVESGEKDLALLSAEWSGERKKTRERRDVYACIWFGAKSGGACRRARCMRRGDYEDALWGRDAVVHAPLLGQTMRRGV